MTIQTIRPFAVNAGLAATAWLKGEVGMMLYGIAGPHIGVKVGVRLDAETGRNPFWRLSGTFSGYYGLIVDLPVLGRLVSHSRNLFSISTDVAESPNSAPVIRIVNPAHSVQLGEPFNLHFSVADGVCFGHYCVFDPEDGTIEFQLESDLDGTLTATNHLFTTPGLRTITISAVDSQGIAATGSFTVNVINTPPTVFGSAGGSTTQATVPFYISAAVTDPNTELDCGALTWQVTAPDTYTSRDQSDSSCLAEVIFNVVGERSVTISATDPQGAVSSPRTFTVMVGAPPVNPPPVITELFQVLACTTQFPPCDDPIAEGGYAFGILTLTIRAEDEDGVSYSFFAQCSDCEDNSRLELGTNSIGDLVWDPPELGTWTLGVTVSDGTSAINMVRTVIFSVIIL